MWDQALEPEVLEHGNELVEPERLVFSSSGYALSLSQSGVLPYVVFSERNPFLLFPMLFSFPNSLMVFLSCQTCFLDDIIHCPLACIC